VSRFGLPVLNLKQVENKMPEIIHKHFVLPSNRAGG
jgi:hypothetical protein